MDTLDNTEWDVVIAGTGFAPSLLALSLSRSGKRILHLDRNGFYGDDEAALSVSEAEAWALTHAGEATNRGTTFCNARLEKPCTGTLSFSRAYSLALAPQLIYARSNLLPALVSSRIHEHLDFQAVGSWFTLNIPSQSNQNGSRPRVSRVPGGREDIFQDPTLDLRTKRNLMKFLRFVVNYDSPDHAHEWNEKKHLPFAQALSVFGLPDFAQRALFALVVHNHPEKMMLEQAAPRIATHLRSMGMFGPGFSAVVSKWGGLAEIAQVACRACAVGGGVYVLNKSITAREMRENGTIHLELDAGEKVKTTWLAATASQLADPAEFSSEVDCSRPGGETVERSISIVSSALTELFPVTAEGAVTPAGAVVTVFRETGPQPVHIVAHSGDSGECPAGQSVLYASTSAMGSHREAAEVLADTVDLVLQSLQNNDEPRGEVLLRLSYTYCDVMDSNPTQASNVDNRGADDGTRPRTDSGQQIVILPRVDGDLVLKDAVLEDVQKVWAKITSRDSEEFMKFETRTEAGDDDNSGFA